MPSAQEPEYFGVTRVIGPDGGPLPVSSADLAAAVGQLGAAISSLTRAVGFSLPGAAGWPIVEARQAVPGNLLVEARQATAANFQMTATLASGQTLAGLTNQAQIGGYAANDYIPAILHMQAADLRRNITVT